ncbi:MAG: ATP-binding protein [Rubrivivax sp.]
MRVAAGGDGRPHARLKQVLLNLLANAIKYNAAGGKVQVRIAADDAASVGVEVTDTGPGLPAAAVQRLFTAFERLGAERGPSKAPASAWR